MFCPECGALSFPDSKGWIKCPDYKCGYNGPLDNKMKDPVTGQEIDLGNVQSSSKAVTRKFEVIDDSEQSHGVLTSGSYICPKCDGQEVFSELRQTRASFLCTLLLWNWGSKGSISNLYWRRCRCRIRHTTRR